MTSYGSTSEHLEGTEGGYPRSGQLRQYVNYIIFGKLRHELFSFDVFELGVERHTAPVDFYDNNSNLRPNLALGGITPAAREKARKANKMEEILRG